MFWKTDKTIRNGKIFTYIKKSGSITIYIALIVMAIVEIIVTHIIILRHFSFWVSMIFLYLNIYTFIFIIAHLKAMYLRPIEIKEGLLYLKNGLFANATISISDIKEITLFENDFDYKRKGIFKFALIKKMENHNVKIILNKEVKINIIYGFTKKANEIYLFIDDKNAFYNLIQESIQVVD